MPSSTLSTDKPDQTSNSTPTPEPVPAGTDRFRNVIFFSGGVCSYLAARRVLQHANRSQTVLLFCDTHAEDEDCYRFIVDAATQLRCRLVTIDDGRTPWQVFRDERCIGNNFKDPCSRILKRRLARAWIVRNCNPATTTLYLGLAWYEERRITPNRKAWHPWATAYPMCTRPLLDRCEMLAAVRDCGLTPPRLYQLGFEHNNCGGACVKAGRAAWRLLLNKLPERYAEQEEHEHRFRTALHKNATILTMPIDGIQRPITLEAFRYYCETHPTPDRDEDWGGCACMLDPTPDDLPAPP